MRLVYIVEIKKPFRRKEKHIFDSLRECMNFLIDLDRFYKIGVYQEWMYD